MHRDETMLTGGDLNVADTAPDLRWRGVAMPAMAPCRRPGADS